MGKNILIKMTTSSRGKVFYVTKGSSYVTRRGGLQNKEDRNSREPIKVLTYSTSDIVSLRGEDE